MVALAAFTPACGRSALDPLEPDIVTNTRVDSGPRVAVSDAAPACSTPTLGTLARRPASPRTGASNLVDPDDDCLLMFGGEDAEANASLTVSAADLSTGAVTPLARTGDDSVHLGPRVSPVWDPLHHRAIVLGGSLSRLTYGGSTDDIHQVFTAELTGGQIRLAQLPPYPDGVTDDLSLAAVFDADGDRVLVASDKGAAGPVDVYALSASPGSEAWAPFLIDSSPSLANVRLTAFALDPVRRLLFAFGQDMDTYAITTWSTSLDQPQPWASVPGILPPALSSYLSGLGGPVPFAWDEAACGFVLAITGDGCIYEAWRFAFGGVVQATSLGIAPQPATQFGRGVASFDARRGNFVFAGGNDCFYNQDVAATSIDFVRLGP